MIKFKDLSNTKIALRLAGYFRNRKECFLGVKSLVLLALRRIPANTVLIAEPNDFHGEILPGFVKYFRDLGYKVIVMMRYNNLKENPFCRFDEPPETYCMTVWGMKHFLRSRKNREKFSYVLLSSALAYIVEHRFYGRYTDFLGLSADDEENIGMIEHEFSEEDYSRVLTEAPDDDKTKKELVSKTFVLTPFTFAGYDFPMLNPCYFGRVNKKKSLNPDKRVFVAVGKISDKTRNFDKLLSAIEALPEDVPYEVRVIGKGSMDFLSEKCRRHVRIMGRLSFEDMFRCMEEADFFLPLLEPETQSMYLEYCTSGSRQLILAFGKVPVIHKEFAYHFGLDETCSAVYISELLDGMKFALGLDDEAYGRMAEKICEASDRVYEESFDNLKKRLMKAD